MFQLCSADNAVTICEVKAKVKFSSAIFHVLISTIRFQPSVPGLVLSSAFFLHDCSVFFSAPSEQDYIEVKEEDEQLRGMARKKATQRKLKVATKPTENNSNGADIISRSSRDKTLEELTDSKGKDQFPKAHVKDEQINAQKYLKSLLSSEDRTVAISGESSTGATSLTDQTASSAPFPDQHLSKQGATVPVSSVKIKEEHKTGFESQTCSQPMHNTHQYTSEKEHAVPVSLVKVKQERLSGEANSDLNSCTLPCTTGPAMDLGSHLQQSLSVPPNAELTWTQLMEAKNLPRIYEPGRCQTDQVWKKENSDPTERPPVLKSSTELDTQSYPSGSIVLSESTNRGRNSPAEGDMLSISGNRSSPGTSGSSTLSSSNRFSSSSGNGAKIILSEGSGAGNILDLSKKTLPPAIRRVLASKYGIPKRNEEIHSAGIVPNFNKSRSRFTVAAKKVPGTGSDGESSDNIKACESPPSMVLQHEIHSSEGKPNGRGPAQTSAGFSSSTETSHTVIQSKTCDQPKSKFTSNSLVPENRESNHSPSAQYLALDHRSTKDMSDSLKSHGLLDLGSHYGDLLKDSSPSVTPTSSSRSPRMGELAGSPRPQNPAEPMIDLGSLRTVNEREGPQHRRAGEAMIDLSSMEKPKSPRSPSYKSISLAGRNCRPNNYSGRNYRPTTSTGNFRSCGSPGLSSRPPIEPKQNRPSSPEYQTSGGPLIDLGSFGKGTDFRSIISSRLPENDTELRFSRVTLGGEKRSQKRTLSVDSKCESDPGKRLRMERNDESLEVKKTEAGTKLNIGNLLKLEQEEQKYIQDLSVVQAQVTNIRFTVQKMQQELEALQCSETDIKRLIDVVRTKRLKILKDAQDREGSLGTRESYGPKFSNDRKGRMGLTAGRGQGDDFVERRMEYDQRSPGFRNSYHYEHSDGFGGTSETKRKFEIVSDSEAEKEDLRRKLERSETRRLEIPDEVSDRFDSYQDNHLYRNRQSPLELVMHSSYNSSKLHNAPYNCQYPMISNRKNGGHKTGRQSLGKFAVIDVNESGRAFQDKTLRHIEKYEDAEDCAIPECEDGALLVQQHRFPRTQPARKGSSSVILEEIDIHYQANAFDSSKEDYSPDRSKQFLGCLEISSTTEELLTENDESHKEVRSVTRLKLVLHSS